MGKIVTFSFDTKYADSVETESFTFEKLGIDEKIDETEIELVLEDILKAWVWDKLNISFSIIIEEENTHNSGE